MVVSLFVSPLVIGLEFGKLLVHDGVLGSFGPIMVLIMDYYLPFCVMQDVISILVSLDLRF